MHQAVLAEPAHEHDREVDWIKVSGSRSVHFNVYCTICGATSPVYRLRGHRWGRTITFMPEDLAQACDDVLDQGDKYLP